MATIEVRARGHQQQAIATLRLTVDPAQTTAAPPPVELIHVPKHPTVGMPGVFVLRASGCSTATAQITGPGEDSPTWSFPCPARRAEFTWTPSAPGDYLLTTTARVEGGPTTSQTMPITVAPAPGTGLSPTPSAIPSVTRLLLVPPPPSPTRSPIPEITTSTVTNGGRPSQRDASLGATPWRRHLLVAASCAVLGLVVHEMLRFLPTSVATVGLGIGLIGASFMLAWAADAG